MARAQWAATACALLIACVSLVLTLMNGPDAREAEEAGEPCPEVRAIRSIEKSLKDLRDTLSELDQRLEGLAGAQRAYNPAQVLSLHRTVKDFEKRLDTMGRAMALDTKIHEVAKSARATLSDQIRLLGRNLRRLEKQLAAAKGSQPPLMEPLPKKAPPPTMDERQQRLREEIMAQPELFAPVLTNFTNQMGTILRARFDDAADFLDLGDDQIPAIKNALNKDITMLQELAYGFENGSIELDDMREQFWDIWDGTDNSVANLVDAEQMDKFMQLKNKVLTTSGGMFLDLVAGGTRGSTLESPIKGSASGQ